MRNDEIIVSSEKIRRNENKKVVPCISFKVKLFLSLDLFVSNSNVFKKLDSKVSVTFSPSFSNVTKTLNKVFLLSYSALKG